MTTRATRHEARRQRAPGHDPARSRVPGLPHGPTALATSIRPSFCESRGVGLPRIRSIGTPIHPDRLAHSVKQTASNRSSRRVTGVYARPASLIPTISIGIHIRRYALNAWPLAGRALTLRNSHRVGSGDGEASDYAVPWRFNVFTSLLAARLGNERLAIRSQDAARASLPPALPRFATHLEMHRGLLLARAGDPAGGTAQALPDTADAARGDHGHVAGLATTVATAPGVCDRLAVTVMTGRDAGTSATAGLGKLAAEMDGRRYSAGLVATPGRHPHLRVTNRIAAQLTEDILLRRQLLLVGLG